MERAALMLGFYRKTDAWDPDAFLTGIAAILGEYSDDIIDEVTHPSKGIPSRLKFPPQPVEVRDACEAVALPRRKAAEHNRRTQEQLAERKLLESSPSPKQSHDEFKAEMAERGLMIDTNGRAHRETPQRVRDKLGLTQEQWDALPDTPHSSYWRGAGGPGT